jgi:hypothetical protein
MPPMPTRWDGEEPRIESHMDFDASIAIGLASVMTERELGRPPTPEEVAPHVLHVVRGLGASVSWHDLDRGVELIDQGRPIHYVGRQVGGQSTPAARRKALPRFSASSAFMTEESFRRNSATARQARFVRLKQ